MYQYEWFNKQLYLSDVPSIPQEKYYQIYNELEYIRLSLWEEHCLECGPPYCYKSCNNYYQRNDYKCRNLSWGIYQIPLEKECYSIIDIQFRPWAKLETRIYPGAFSIKTTKKFDTINKIISVSLFNVSSFLKFLSPKMKLLGGFTYFKKKLFKKINLNSSIVTNIFLLKCYSHYDLDFRLFFEISENGTTILREGIKLLKGYNEKNVQLPINKFNFKNEYLMRIYPENNIEAHLTIYFCDLINTNNALSPIKLPQIKCVVWDLDNTIWDGILSESEESNLKIRTNVLEVITEFDKRGILQSICSKNDYDATYTVLKNLGIENFFLYPKINWNSKSSNIKLISEELNIDLNTFAFIDDSVFEREEVHSIYPQIRVYNENDVSNLLNLSDFDVPITDDSKERRAMYQTESKRKNIQKNFHLDTIEFLKECRIVLTIFKPETENESLRCFELLQRTNQLNLSAQKYTYVEFSKKIIDDKKSHYAFSCSDKFGSYGIVGYIEFSIQMSTLIVNEFAMSCRVAEKTIENSITFWLQNICTQEACDEICFLGNKTVKNSLLQNNLLRIGYQNEGSSEKIVLKIKSNTLIEHLDIINMVIL